MTTINAVRDLVYDHVVQLRVWECPVQGCGIVYGIPEAFADALRSSGGSYYCPNGHRLSWHEDDAARERKKRQAAERRAESAENAAKYQRQRAERERRSAIALRGHLTRMRNRIAAGVCPVPGCHRSGFSQVMRHLSSKHPGWLAEHVHELRPEPPQETP